MNTQQRDDIRKHGEDLLKLFPNATEQDPVDLCRKLRRLETRAHRLAEMECNGEIEDQASENEEIRILCGIQRLLTDRDGRVWLNGDPRGYALKIDLKDGERLYIDWGGYGIIAPEIGEEGLR